MLLVLRGPEEAAGGVRARAASERETADAKNFLMRTPEKFVAEFCQPFM
jgi:hypothetical protein